MGHIVHFLMFLETHQLFQLLLFESQGKDIFHHATLKDSDLKNMFVGLQNSGEFKERKKKKNLHSLSEEQTDWVTLSEQDVSKWCFQGSLKVSLNILSGT